MRKTLTTLVLTAALASPGATAFAATPDASTTHSAENASCNNTKGGNGAEYNEHGGPAVRAELCKDAVDVDPAATTAATGPGTGAKGKTSPTTAPAMQF